ncbi:DUF416 family protein [Pontibacter sp. HSC-36F09]|uniref:DUF416 family protein n=1 Tax=Pontibacter sp. HSC-36F09 TaxID=2910966 RepID=UPI00209F2B7A|nr:DUF416 family protein [Pontibacter sp. HSC-36F09]MCP2042191.1 uncharacterized protein YjaG (DUF416 family) [Pontibacter sp. HSC-36F09]
MSSEEFINILEERVERLSNVKVIDFALNICHRLLPYYIKFFDEYNWGNIEALSEGIRFCEKLKNLKSVEKNVVQDLMQQIEEALTDTEEFEDGSLALNASAAVLELVEYVLDKDLSHILNISSYMTDTIDFIARENVNELSVNHQELVKERKYQLELISQI